MCIELLTLETAFCVIITNNGPWIPSTANHFYDRIHVVKIFPYIFTYTRLFTCASKSVVSDRSNILVMLYYRALPVTVMLFCGLQGWFGGTKMKAVIPFDRAVGTLSRLGAPVDVSLHFYR